MKAISHDVLKGIEPEIEKVHSCIVNAVRHYQERIGDESGTHSPLTKASYIRHQIIENIKKDFFGNPKVEIKRKRGMTSLVIHTEPIIVLKFKKFDKNNRVCPTRTMQSYMYSNQLHLFPEYSRTVNLHAGYKWDDTGTMVECIIGMPNSEREHAWIVVLKDRSIAPEATEAKTVFSEEIKPNIKLKVKEIRNKNEQAG